MKGKLVGHEEAAAVQLAYAKKYAGRKNKQRRRERLSPELKGRARKGKG